MRGLGDAGILAGVPPRNPTIRFFDGPTGHRIAYAQHGRGPALVCAAWWVSHLEEDWKQDGFREFFERLGQYFTVYRYDRAGTGLSDRERDRVDPVDEVRTLHGLIEHLGLERLSLFGLTCACPPALDFAAHAPERVDKLVLFGSYVRGRDVAPPEFRESLGGLVRSHWGLGSTLVTDLFDPDIDGEARSRMSRLQRASASSEMAALLLKMTFETDVTDLAPRVQTPTLVLHRKDDRTIRFAAGREMAATLPNATFRPLDGGAHVPWAGDIDAVFDALVEFFELDDADRPSSEGAPPFALCNDGDVWTLTFGGVSAHLKDARGLADLAILLAHPDQAVLAEGLWAGEPAPAAGGASDPLLDDDALGAYRTRLREIDAELETASAERVDALQDERDAIARELRSGLGLGGRRRELDPASERARKAVSARLRASIQKISEVLPPAGAHLKNAVITGTYCHYQSADGVDWVVR